MHSIKRLVDLALVTDLRLLFRDHSQVSIKLFGLYYFYLIKGSKSPEPGTYTLKSEFEIGKPGTSNSNRKAGIYSFGIGR
jgi:hypothetical protein